MGDNSDDTEFRVNADSEHATAFLKRIIIYQSLLFAVIWFLFSGQSRVSFYASLLIGFGSGLLTIYLLFDHMDDLIKERIEEAESLTTGSDQTG